MRENELGGDFWPAAPIEAGRGRMTASDPKRSHGRRERVT